MHPSCPRWGYVGVNGGRPTGRRQNYRVANELCHSERKVNADWLARVT